MIKFCLLIFVISISFSPVVFSHGRLISPTTRSNTVGYENDPTGTSSNGGNNNDNWVCRWSKAQGPTPVKTVTPGSTIQLVWKFGAAHVGDCDAYISYDVNSARKDMQWFKIANFPDCRAQASGTPVNMEFPTWLKNGPFTLRWGWYALHQFPGVEFYSQCSDMEITGGKLTLPTGLITYPLIGPRDSKNSKPIFPIHGNDGVGYRYPFPPAQSWMTGPKCGMDFPGNNCGLTAPGTKGHIAVDGDKTTGNNPPGIPVVTTRPPEVGGTCPQKCYTCQTNPSGKLCTLWCSPAPANWCGDTADHKVGTDCRGCSSSIPGVKSPDNPTAVTGPPDNCSTKKWIRVSDRVPSEDWCQTTCSTFIQYCDSNICACDLSTPITQSVSSDSIMLPLLSSIISFLILF